MRTVIAIDSFKGSLSSIEAGTACAEGIKRAYPESENIVMPVADGGEGTVDALTMGMGGEKVKITVCGPLGNKVEAEYGIIHETNTAIMEMSAAAGITLVADNERNPLNTTTYGVGEIIADAIGRGCRNFIIGIGGSATNDGGIGMLQALGFGILDKSGNQVPLGAKGIKEIYSITTDNVSPLLSECSFSIACDVTNPLCGDNGCSAVYGPQKGADEKMISDMDGWLSEYAKKVREVFLDADENYPGAGAAGGIGFAFMAFLQGKLQNGIELILEKTGIEEYIKNADVVITGEGRLDRQTVMGKAPGGVAKLAKKYDKKIIAFSGSVTRDAREVNNAGIDAFFPVLRTVCTLDEAMNTENAFRNMADTAEQVFLLMKGCLDE